MASPPPCHAAGGSPGRGHRLTGWIEWALEPCRDDLTRKDYDDLVSALALVVGWETFIVLLDVRGLSTGAARTSPCGRLRRSSTPAWRPPRAL